MPNSKPTTTTLDALEDKYARAAAKSLANHAFYLGATNDNLDVIRSLDPRSACGIKIFMGASTGNMLVDNPDTLDAIFREAPTIVVTHCEDTPTIDANLARERERYGNAIPVERHPYIRSREACLKSSTLAIELARRHGTRLHILHITTADELALFSPGPLRGKRITAETCVHFLQFAESDYATLGNLIKCNPAIKSESDRQAIVAALREGRIDVLATDHAPHIPSRKKSLPYEQAPSGLPLVQFALQCALEQVFDGTIPLERIVESVTHAPADLFQVKDRGYLREGYFADLVSGRSAQAAHGETRRGAVTLRLVAIRRAYLPLQHHLDLGQWRTGVGRRTRQRRGARHASGIRSMSGCSIRARTTTLLCLSLIGGTSALAASTRLPDDAQQGQLIAATTEPGSTVLSR